MKALQVDHCLDAAALEQGGDDLLLEHASKLARHAGGEEEARVADVEREAAGGADRIVDDLAGCRQHRLLAVVRRHHAAAAVEVFLHAREDKIDTGSLRGNFLREIVDRRTEPAIDDDGVGALASLTECSQQRLAVIAYCRAPTHRQSEILELLADVTEVAIDDLAGQHLVSGADDLDLHARILPPLAAPAGHRGAKLSSLSTGRYGETGDYRGCGDGKWTDGWRRRSTISPGGSNSRCASRSSWAASSPSRSAAGSFSNRPSVTPISRRASS